MKEDNMTTGASGSLFVSRTKLETHFSTRITYFAKIGMKGSFQCQTKNQLETGITYLEALYAFCDDVLTFWEQLKNDELMDILAGG